MARTSVTINAPDTKVGNALVNPAAIKLYLFGTTVVADGREENQPLVSLAQDNNATEEERKHSEENWGMMLAALKKPIS